MNAFLYVLACVGIGLTLIAAAVFLFFYLAWIVVAFGRLVRWIWRHWDGSDQEYNPHPRHVNRPPDPNGG